MASEVYGFALKPDAIFYLRVKIDDLVTRVLQSTGFDYWESGMDLHMGEDMYESFVRYQKWLLAEFDKMVENYGFQVVDASGTIERYLKICVPASSERWPKTATILECLSGYFSTTPDLDLPHTSRVFSALFSMELTAMSFACRSRSISASKACAVSGWSTRNQPADKLSAINCSNTCRSCQLPSSSCSSFRALILRFTEACPNSLSNSVR